MSLRSFIVGLKPKNILIGIILIGLIVSVTFNILNAPKKDSTIAGVTTDADFTKGFTDGFLKTFGITLVPVIVIIFLIANYEDLFNNQLNAPIPSSDICSVIPGTFTAVSRIPSFYFAHLSFFLSYIFMNAYSIYSMESDDKVDPTLIKNRKYRSFASMILIVIVLLGIVSLRYFTSNCDSPLGLVVTLSIFSFTGFAWYKFAEYCGARNSDIMGISLSIIPQNANKPVVCARTV